jgi:hypothetical protein
MRKIKPMRTDLHELKSFLMTELNQRKEVKPAYSKRAFARDLGVNSTSLTEFLDGKRDLSFKNIDRVFHYLNRKRHCSFCDKSQTRVKKLIAGPRRIHICDTCVDECVQIIGSNKQKPASC